MEYDAVEQALVDCAVGVDQWHSFEEGVDAETYHQPRNGVCVVFVAQAVVVVVMVCFVRGAVRIMVVRIGFFFTTVAVVVSVFDTVGQRFEEQLYQETDEYRDADFDSVDGKTMSVHVRHKIYETRAKKECASKSGNGVEQYLWKFFTLGKKYAPNHYSTENQYIRIYNIRYHFK